MCNKNFPTIVQFIDNYYPMIDGVINVVDSYARLLSKSGYTYVAAPMQSQKHEDNYPYKVLRADSIPLPFVDYRIPVFIDSGAVGQELKCRRFQIFHAHSPFRMGHYALKSGRKYGVKVVATFHSKYYDDVLQITGSSFIARRVTDYIVRFYEQADAVWTVNDETAKTLYSYGYKGDITVVPNATDFEYPDNPEELKKRAAKHFSLPEDVPVLLFVGQQIWQKNLKLVLDTAAQLKTMNYPCLTVIAGNGYAEKEIKAYSNKLGLTQKQVLFTGKITDQELLKGLMLSANIFFFPSPYDNSPLVIREASAMGLPSLLMSGSNAAEKSIDGKDAFHCVNNPHKTAETIVYLLSNPKQLKEVGINAQKKWGKTWNDVFPIILEQYQNILK